MKPTLVWILFCLNSLAALGQDAYHLFLQETLMDQYTLPEGAWLLPDTEAGTLNGAFSYGDMNVANQDATGQPFTRKARIRVNSSGNNQWDSGYGIRNSVQMNQGDAALLVIWLRAEAGGDGQVSVFVENRNTFEKEVYLTFNPPAQWTQYFIPFDANITYTPDNLTIGLHLAWQPQTIEVGGLAVLNYGKTLSVGDLPNKTNNDKYGGYEPDAPWRAEAAARIEQIRKADLTFVVQDAAGNPIPGATVEAEMLQHEFAFGSAVVSRRFAGNPAHNDTYESKILDLDGKGHGFNWVVFENALKWPGWENNWITTPAQTAKAVQWCRDHDIQVRGHCLVWPGWSNLPNDMQSNAGNPDYMKGRIFDHIEEINTYPGIRDNIAEWDVLNEITTNRDLEMALRGKPGYATGREIYAEIFNKLQEAAPGMETYINDYVTISQANTGGGNYDLKKQFAQELIDAGVKLDGIGFQGHIGAFPTSIYDVEAILDDFYDSFGKKAKITEYDTNEGMGDSLAGKYLRDFLTMVFSHPSMNGFMTWGFWDGAHWHSNAPFFYEDWTMKPAGETFIDLVFSEWWTDESGQTNAGGEYKIRGFRGKYKITVDDGSGNVLTDTIILSDEMTITRRGDEISTGTGHIGSVEFRVFPNPAREYLNISLPEEMAGTVKLRMFDRSGRLVFTDLVNGPQYTMPLNFGRGVFEVVVGSGRLARTKTIVIL